jgi:hypothetical protein
MYVCRVQRRSCGAAESCLSRAVGIAGNQMLVEGLGGGRWGVLSSEEASYLIIDAY